MADEFEEPARACIAASHRFKNGAGSYRIRLRIEQRSRTMREGRRDRTRAYTRAPVKRGGIAKPNREGRPTKHEAEELGSRILDAAAELFASRGFAATSMEQVAAACGTGKDTIYRRFPSKAALFTALMERLHDEVLPELDRLAASDQGPLENLRLFSRELVSINLRPHLLALNRVALGEAIPTGDVKPIPARQDPIMTRLVVLVETAQEAGILIFGDAFFIAEQLLYATSVKPLVAAMLGDRNYFERAVQDAHFARAWAHFLVGAKPRDV